MTILRSMFLAALVGSFSVLPVAWGASTAQPPDQIAQEIQRMLADGAPKIGVDEIDASSLRAFYQSRQWRPAWIADAARIETVLASAELDGIPTAPLHLKAIRARLGQTAAVAQQAQADLLMTDAILTYAVAMRGRRVDPMQIEEDWLIPVPPFDAVAFLHQNAKDGVPALETLSPPYAGYQALRRKLAELRAVAAHGDWPKVPAGPTIKPGDSGDRVPAVRKRLMATGELQASDAESAVYDENLQAAVQLFQQRHGLADDANIGRQTVLAMNVSAAERARQIALNMERWRWLPARLGDPHIVVNVPAASFELVENGRAVLSMRTVVGDQEHPTPALTSKLNSLVINPVWRVPASIATEEILPKLKKNPGYLVANDLELVSDSFPPGSPESQGIGVDWKNINTMPWPVRQKSGSDNALGRIKFNIPNGEDIYLHDTPNRKAFGRASRALSHGCIRLEHPDELALYLLRDKGWAADRLSTEIEQGDTHTVQVSKPVQVWLFYWTAWIDGDGVAQYRDDLYGRDQRLSAALAHPSQRPAQQAMRAPAPETTHVCEGCRTP